MRTVKQKKIGIMKEYTLVQEGSYWLVTDTKTGAILHTFTSLDAMLDASLPSEMQRGVCN